MKIQRISRTINFKWIAIFTFLLAVCFYPFLIPTRNANISSLEVENVASSSFKVFPSLANISKVLITTVGRSGSSVFGMYLSQMSNRSYYVFEPFHRYTPSVAQGQFQAQTGELFRLLHAYFTCQVPQDIEKKVYFHTFARLSRRDSTIKPKDPKAPEDVQFREMCPPANLRIVKSIRLIFLSPKLQSDIYKELLEAFPDLAIIVLYRDPRNVFLSSIERNFDVAHVRDICAQQLSLHESLGFLASKESKFPHKNRIITIKREHFVQDPKESINNLSKLLLGRPLDVSGANWITKEWNRPRRGSSYEVTDNTTQQTAKVAECQKLAKLLDYEEIYQYK